MLPKTKLISDKELYDSIVNLIKKSKKDLKISSPWVYNCDHILDELIAMKKRGVKISVVMRQPKRDLGDKNYQDKLNAIDKLKEAKADIIFDPYVHEKVVISDGKEMIISSANLIGTSLVRNGESGTHTNDPREIEKYQLRLAKKYKKKPVNAEKTFLEPKSILFAAIVVVVLAIAILSQTVSSSPYTVSGVLNAQPLNQVVTVMGVVASNPEDYIAKTTGNIFQQFYITDGSRQLKIFCSKDEEPKISQNDRIGVTGKFILFGDEYEITEIDCSSIIKR